METKLDEQDFRKWLIGARKYPLCRTDGVFHTPAYMDYYNKGFFSKLLRFSIISMILYFKLKCRSNFEKLKTKV